MSYRIARNGQIFGPYTEAEVHQYLATGHIVPSDLAQAEGADRWLPVAQLFAAVMPGTPPPVPTTPYPGGVPTLYPDPPDMPWWIALILGCVTLGGFFVAWDLVQSSWLRRVDRSSTAFGYYIAVAVVYLLKLQGAWSTFRYNLGYDVALSSSHYSGLLVLAGIVLFFASRFVFRNELLRHFNTVEPIGLRLGAFMTIVFGGVYFQYHFNRINELKRGEKVRF